MPQRHAPRRSYHVEAEVTPSAPPSNWVTTLGNSIPLPYVIGGLVAAIWYFGVGTTKQENVQDVVKKLETKIEQVNVTSATSTKEQDERRAAMAKEFLASNKEIATKVGELGTALAVQQATQKATSDALVKIGDQLQQLNAAARTERR